MMLTIDVNYVIYLYVCTKCFSQAFFQIRKNAENNKYYNVEKLSGVFSKQKKSSRKNSCGGVFSNIEKMPRRFFLQRKTPGQFGQSAFARAFFLTFPEIDMKAEGEFAPKKGQNREARQELLDKCKRGNKIKFLLKVQKATYISY